MEIIYGTVSAGYTSPMRARQFRQGVTIGVLLILIFWLATLIYGLVGKASIAMSEEKSVEWQYHQLEARKATLEQNLAALGTARGKDAAIRTAFGVARPGEEVIVVVPPATTTPTATPSWWERVKGWFW